MEVLVLAVTLYVIHSILNKIVEPWEKGRQNTGYEKLKLYQFLNMDCYLLRYKVGDSIPTHTDPVPGRKHYRLNFELKKPEKGGKLRYGPCSAALLDTIVKSENKRIVFFRSDIIPHSVTEIKKGERLVLTFGIAI